MSNLKMCILCGCSFEPETTDQVTCKNCYSKTIKNVDKYRVAYLGQRLQYTILFQSIVVQK